MERLHCVKRRKAEEEESGPVAFGQGSTREDLGELQETPQSVLEWKIGEKEGTKQIREKLIQSMDRILYLESEGL